MKERKEMIVVGYEAYDGKVFTSRDECRKYEETARAVIVTDFRKLVINFVEAIEITNEGCVPLTELGEDWVVGLIKLNNESDLKIANMYASLNRGVGDYFKPEMIGKEILCYVGDGDSECCRWNGCGIYGTVDECVEKYRNGLMKLVKGGEKDEVQ